MSARRKFFVLAHIDGEAPLYTVEFNTDPDAALDRGLRAIWAQYEHEDVVVPEYDPDQMVVDCLIEFTGEARLWATDMDFFRRGIAL